MPEKDTNAPVTIYTTVFCPYCHGAKKFFEQKGIPYEEIDLTGRDNFREFLVDLTGQRSVPQILIHGDPIGGYTDLLKLAETGELDERLEEAPEVNGK